MRFFPHFISKFSLAILAQEFDFSSSIDCGCDIRKPKNISIGKNSIINKRVLLDGRGGELFIGSHVDIAQEVMIWTMSHDPHDDSHSVFKDRTTIENYVWLGVRSMVMPGVTVGYGSVVTAGSIVTKDVPPMTIVAGVPARKIGVRENKCNYNLKSIPWYS